MYLFYNICGSWNSPLFSVIILFKSVSSNREDSVQFSRSVMSNCLWSHGLQHRLACPSPTPETCCYSYPSCRWWHTTISSSVVSFSFCLQSFPVSGSFQWVSSLQWVAKVLEFQLHHQSFQWIFRTDISFRMDWLDLLAVQGTLKSLLQHNSSKASILQLSAFFIVQFSNPFMTTGKTWLMHAGSSIFVAAHRIFSCGMCDLVPWSGMEPVPTTLWSWSLSHWTTREVL